MICDQLFLTLGICYRWLRRCGQRFRPSGLRFQPHSLHRILMTNSVDLKLKKSISFLLVLFSLAMAAPDCLSQQSVPDLAEASLEELGTIKVYSASKHL